MTADQVLKKVYCNVCRRTTNHKVVASYPYHFREEDIGATFAGRYNFLVCAGCDTATLEDVYTWDGSDWNEETEEFIPETLFHPKRSVDARHKKHFSQLPGKLERIYHQVIEAHNENLNILVAAGLRSLLEGVCADKKIPGGSLDAKIEGMKTLLPQNIVESLHGFRFIGNRALHELEAPKKSDLNLAIDVIDDLLNFLYQLDYKASLLRKFKEEGQAKSPSTPTVAPDPEKPATNLGNCAEVEDPNL